MADFIVSVCIPTCNRPKMLEAALASCLRQPLLPAEILVGDDSQDQKSAAIVNRFSRQPHVEIKYWKHSETIGQAANLNWLIDNANSQYLIFLHDDDRLCADATKTLYEAWLKYPGAQCFYGKQYLTDYIGNILPDRTDSWNHRYFRTREFTGRQTSNLSAALSQQIPNNGFLVTSELARTTRYRSEKEIGHAVDADFGIRIALAANKHSFVYVDRFVSEYRLNPDSISQSLTLNRREDALYEYIEGLKIPRDDERARTGFLERIAVAAVLDAARAGRRRSAIRIIFSRHYKEAFLSRWTLYRLVCIISPVIGERVRRLLTQINPNLAGDRERQWRQFGGGRIKE
ncbi:glycosyltransferase family 2 protein [Rhizobium sp. BK379]|uniref:glycosyltransferase family 2 protein n=1 Tax=Rhizobium sp. BK379 TaxID=2587059 RepID=UPI0017A52A7E|nr:glycosyltransferase involved in cell wall biosynthesis [Rhizobium sp. BK379]